MKISWIHDFKLSQWLGGAQITNEYMLSESPLEVETFYPQDFDRSKVDGTLIILNNTGLFSRSDLYWIITTQKYIKYEHDYSFCKHRHAAEHDCSTECSETLSFYTEMFQNSLLNIFLSPAHRDVYLKYMDIGNIHLQPSPINVDRFKYSGPKEELYIAVGEDSWHKGSDIVKSKYSNKNFRFIGGANKVPYEEIHKWFHRAKYFVHLPRWVEPFGRTVAEAYCSNCELILNDRVGFSSYDWDYSDRSYVMNKLTTAPKIFWETVCSL